MKASIAPALLLALAAPVAWAQPAPAPADAPAGDPVPPATPAPAPAPATATPATTSAPVDLGTLSDEELIRLAETKGEQIEIWDERPDKPFDRDTQVRLTGEELAQRGATDLASALELLPDVNVRDAGRGGFVVDIRGARKGAVRVLIDGVSVSDPYYGTFDVSTIPVTDIVQIRVSTSPASPIDGPGGPGGVIEVHTRDAAGARLVVARLTSSSMPTFGGSATGRTELARHLSIRLSTSALWGMHEFALPGDASVDEGRRATTGAVRLEYRRGARRVALDGFVDDRTYVVPPSEDVAGNILLIDRETTGRAQLAADEQRGALQLQGRAWIHAMGRRSRSFRDPALTDLATGEDLTAIRTGALALATRPIGKTARWVASATVDHERARVEATTTGNRTRGDATLIETAAGAQYERGPIRLDGAAGLAVPLGLGADPWPEAKLVARYQPVAALALVATVGRKGRIPTLRERFDTQTGNPALAPELANHGELRAIVTPADEVSLEVAPYWRRSNGILRAGPSTMLENLGQLDVRGVDLIARARLLDPVEVGASYLIAHAEAEGGGNPLDFFPTHRADGWVRVTPDPRVSVLARGRYTGASDDRMQVVPANLVVDASASAELGGDWLAVLRCDDVLDERPEVRSGVLGPGRVLSLLVQGTWD